MSVVIRPYSPFDADGWVRCRVLSFLQTSYFDDVRSQPTEFENPAVRIVAVADGTVVGLIDVEVDGKLATIDSIAVLPEWQGRGVASELLTAAMADLGDQVESVDAWTREDPAANAWYLAHGFAAEAHYLHVYASWADSSELDAPEGLRIVGAFMHAALEDEAEMRRRFKRVHVCRRYVRPAVPPDHDAVTGGD